MLVLVLVIAVSGIAINIIVLGWRVVVAVVLVVAMVTLLTLVVIANQRHWLSSSCWGVVVIGAVVLILPMVLVVIAIGSDQVLFEASEW